MATVASRQRPAPTNADERFFLTAAILMCLTIVAGFSFQLAMGRSTFASPLRVHVHAVLFMGWVFIYLMQNVLVSSGRVDLHRRLGWIAVVWVPLMVIMGTVVTVAMVRNGHVPFFFRPQHFLIFDPINVLAFAGLTLAAVAMRRRTDWHRRLHFCGMSTLLAPAFGRLLPLPLLQPLAWEVSFMAAALFPLAGMWLDRRRRGAVHPAWIYGLATMAIAFAATEAITYSPLGDSIYQAVTSGSPGESVPALEFAPAPEGPLMTGRDS